MRPLVRLIRSDGFFTLQPSFGHFGFALHDELPVVSDSGYLKTSEGIQMPASRLRSSIEQFFAKRTTFVWHQWTTDPILLRTLQ